MKVSLFSEEGRAARGGHGPFTFIAILWLLISICGGVLFYRHHTKPNLSPLQHVYLTYYYTSFFKSHFLPFSPESTYWVLQRSVKDPKTKKDNLLGCTDETVKPDFDEDGSLRVSKDGLPSFLLKSEYVAETTPKTFGWYSPVVKDKVAYNWFRNHIYGGQAAYELFYPALLSTVLFCIPGLIGASLVQRKMTKRYLQGKPLRGTRELNPKEYERLHQRDNGISLEVFIPGKGN